MKHYDVAAYIWPAYTGDEPRTRMFWPEGIGEWQTVKNAAPKENGYTWDRKPLWGYQNEADPAVMEGQIEAALSHGINTFIYDWYWYDDRPFLEQCLDNGFLKARNNRKMKFYLMWANHDANHCWNRALSDTYGKTVIWHGDVPRPAFETVARRVIGQYFTQPNYYTINGAPVFMIYDANNLVKGLGGIAQTRDALEWFRAQTRAAGFPDLHLQFTIWSEQTVNLSGFDANMQGSTKDLVRLIGADSVTHYQFCHFTDVARDYREIIEDVRKEWVRIGKTYPVPYFPHISCGWDNNPRFGMFKPKIVRNNTPENLRLALRMAKDYLDAHPDLPPLVTVNSWNEWTETSYLEPDNLYGYGYLEAVRDVFGESTGNP